MFAERKERKRGEIVRSYLVDVSVGPCYYYLALLSVMEKTGAKLT